MSKKQDSHDLVAFVKKLAAELGHTPTRAQFENSMVGGKYRLEKSEYSTYQNLLDAADLPSVGKSRHNPSKKIISEETLLKNYKKLCSKTEQIQGFFVHTLDLKEMFDRAGNPKSLKLVAQPDTHVKFRDVAAVNCFMNFCNYFKPDVHMIMGDFADCEGISHWPSDSLEPRRLIPEMKDARLLLQEIVDKTPTTTTRVYLKGNHEAWIDQAFSRMPELFEGLADLELDINLQKLLALDKFGYDLFEVNHLVRIGKAHFTHGIYAGNGHAKKHLSTFKSNIYYGHVHDDQQHNETSMEGNIEASALGTLSRLDAKFLKGKPNNWVHAFGVFEFFPDGSYNFYKPKINNGRMSFNGHVFDGNL